ncbi:MAG: hypothetical protein K2X93_17790 [Candidatus Obscuribacterales bacterium]|nr:hypothetical protein [Candidatus Obscuribacterales bacterium]
MSAPKFDSPPANLEWRLQGERILIVILTMLVLVGTPIQCASALDLPPESIKTLPLAKEESVSVYVPSEAAPEEGLAVNIIYPQQPRYKDGAPIAVIVPGGHGPNGLRFTMHAAQSGFVEVRFAFPGGGLKQFHSGGSWDERGVESQKALRDVLLFAHGEKTDKNGKHIGDLIPTPVNTNHVGAVGWENGGSVLIITLAKFPLDLGFTKWIAFCESPIGSLLSPSVLGTKKDLNLNRHYRQGSAATGTCMIDFRKLAWQPDVYRNKAEHISLGREPSKGVLFFDENGNKVWEESVEFALAHASEPGGNKKYYAPEVTAALVRLQLFPKKRWPRGVATLKETEQFFQERDATLFVKQIPLQYPDLLVMLYGSKIDQEQCQPDHPHICLNYNLWHASKPKWLRLNPDPNYVGFVADMNPMSFVNNKPDAPIDASTIEAHLEPEGFIPDYIYMQAAISELADRSKKDYFKAGMPTVLFNYMNDEIKKYKRELAQKQAQQKQTNN